MKKTGMLKVAAVASRIKFADVQTNLDGIEKWVSKAAAHGARLVLFPEGAITGYLNSPLIEKNYGDKAQLLKVAEPIPAKSTETLILYAKKNAIYVSAGIAEKDNDKIYNTQVIVEPKGYIGKYRKVHIPTVEAAIYQSGSQWPIFDIEGIKIGINICADKSFPETAKIMALKGAEIILMPHCTSTGRKQPFPGWSKKIIIGRSMDNAVFSLVTNGILDIYEEKSENFAPAGFPFAIDPFGNVIDELKGPGAKEKMLIAYFNLEMVSQRRENPEFNFNLRRPEIYGNLVE